MCIGNCNIARYVYIPTQTDALSKDYYPGFLYVPFHSDVKVYHSAEGNGSTVEGALETMLLRGLPMDLLCMLLKTITP